MSKQIDKDFISGCEHGHTEVVQLLLAHYRENNLTIPKDTNET